MTQYALETQKLTHRYGKHMALDGIDLKLVPGKVYGLLGRNGAGKTTLLNTIMAAHFPTGGKALIFGETPHEHVGALKKTCVVREKGQFPPGIRVREVLAVARGLYPNWDDAYAKELVGLFQLNPKKRYKQLSRGMESSLGLIVGLASRAELTVFDEPSLGLDAVARENFYDQLQHDMDKHPRTVIISTHLIDEVSRIFDHVVIIDKGRILRDESTDSLIRSAVLLTGQADAVERAAQGHRVLRRDALGGVSFAAVLVERDEAFEGVEVEPLPLQKLFVYLTEEGGASA